MKWAIALRCGHGCMLWNGDVFSNSEADAAKFAKEELANKAMKTIFLQEPPEDADDYEFDSRLYIQAVA